MTMDLGMTDSGPKTIGIVGSRRRNTRQDKISVKLAFDKIYKPGDVIVSGGCPKGGDCFAEEIAKEIAKEHGISITIHYPDWYPDGYLDKSAGFKRNTKIAADCDILIACVSLDRTGGTVDTINKVTKLGKQVILC